MAHTFSPLLRWFKTEGRDLPWRRTRDPYRIWISEIMLQQTQVDRVVDYYQRFLERFPNVEALAKARWPQVLSAWRGLGYYRRARNMMRTAKEIVRSHGGVFPESVDELLDLPGIGPYTARAIAVFAFEQDELMLDTNVKRVLQRFYGLEVDDRKAWLWARKEEIVPRGRSWPFHQALMDLGSSLCSAQAPACAGCPLRRQCAFPGSGKEASPPSRAGRRGVPPPDGAVPMDIAAGVIFRQGQVLIAKRPSGHFAGCWEFPGGKRKGKESLRACLKREIKEELGIEVAVRPHEWEALHLDDELSLRIRFHRCSILRGTPAPRLGQKLKWVEPQRLARHRFPPANKEIVEQLSRARFVDPHG